MAAGPYVRADGVFFGGISLDFSRFPEFLEREREKVTLSIMND